MPTSRRRSPKNDQDSPWSSRTIEFAVCVERTEEECSRVLLAECAQEKAKDRRKVAGDAAMLAGSPVANACAGQRLSWPWRWRSLKAGPAFHDVGQLAPFEAVWSIAPGPIFRNNSDRVAAPWREASGLGFSMMNWLYERDSKPNTCSSKRGLRMYGGSCWRRLSFDRTGTPCATITLDRCQHACC